MNTNGGNWGMNSAYLTPSYTAPYRPGYGGQQGAGYSGNPGFFRSANALLNPFAASAPKWGNPNDYNQQFYDGLSNTPADAATWGAQKIVAPAASAFLAYKLGQITTTRVGGASSFSGRAAMGWDALWGGTTGTGMKGAEAWKAAMSGAADIGGTVGAAGARQGIFAAFGASAGRGAMKGLFGAANFMTGGRLLGGAAGLATAAGFEGAAGVLGGVVGGLSIPMLLAQGGVEAAQQAFFNPYIATRGTASTLRSNFAHVTLGGSDGDVLTGRGLSRTAAYKTASSITQAGIKDYTLDEFGMGKVADLSARAGLLDNSSVGQISGKVKDIAKIVKMMMNLTNDPDIKNSIETIVKLKSAGVSMGGMGGVMSSIAMSSAIAGISTQRMMNTVGAQGQYLAQANGIVPYMGQIVAGHAMAGFSSAYRTGLINNSTMAMMGGVEGATQSLVSGSINAGQTTFNRMGLYNQYMTGNSSNSVAGTISNFGADFAKDPMAALGKMELNDNMMRTAQLKERGGVLSIQDQIMKVGSLIPNFIDKKTGLADGNKAFVVMTRLMGMSPEEARAELVALHAGKDPKSIAQSVQAVNGLTSDTLSQIENQNGLGNGILNNVIYPVRQNLKALRAAGSEDMTRMLNPVAVLGDALEKKYGSAVYGDTLFRKDEKFGDATSSGYSNVTSSSIGKAARLGSLATIDKINKAAKGDLGAEAQTAANALLNAKTPSEKKAAYESLVKAGVVGLSDQSKVLETLDGAEIAKHDGGGGQPAKISSLLRTIISDKGGASSDIQKEITIGHAHMLAGLTDADYLKKRDEYGDGKGTMSKNDPLYGAFKDMTARYGGNVRDRAQYISNLAMDKGVITAALKFGGFADDADLETKVMANKEQYLGKDGAAELDKSLKGVKDSSTRRNIIGMQYAKSNKLSVVDPHPKYIDMVDDPDVRRSMLAAYQAKQDRMDQIWQLQKEGKIDTDTALNSDSVNKLGEYVEQFGTYVDAFGKNALSDWVKEKLHLKK
jgi:hypothetical protein